MGKFSVGNATIVFIIIISCDVNCVCDCKCWHGCIAACSTELNKKSVTDTYIMCLISLSQLPATVYSHRTCFFAGNSIWRAALSCSL